MAKSMFLLNSRLTCNYKHITYDVELVQYDVRCIHGLVFYSRLVATTVLAAMEDVSLFPSVNFNRPLSVLATMSASPKISVKSQNVLPRY